LADTNTRQGKRTPVTLKIKFKSETLEQFIERYAVDVSQGGIFIRTKEPLAVGTQMKFEFQLRDASPLIAGEGTVVWTRENDPSRPAIAPGMGVRFDKLAEGSQQVLEKILAEKAKQAPQRAHTEQTKPPMFTDTPTRVAPAPVQDALLGSRTDSKNKIPRPRSDSEQTPLPKPMPFHSDADEYPEEAFEEATKVRSLDELVAQTAGADKAPVATVVMPLDELAARRQAGRADSTLADPPSPGDDLLQTKNDPDRESAPGLPNPPSVEQPARKSLDTSPSPRPRTPSEESAPVRASKPSVPPAEAAKTKLGVEPAKASTSARGDRDEKTEKVDAKTATARDSSRSIPPARPSSAPIIIGVLVLVAAGVAALWFFVLREPAAENAKAGSGDQIVTPGSADTGSSLGMTTPGSADTGSNMAMVGSGSAVGMTATGSAAMSAMAKPVDTVISSAAAKATVEIEGLGQSGPAPFTVKLDKDKPYKAHVSAPGFIAKTIDLKGGDKANAKLDPKPRTLSVSSDPPGAEIFVDGASTGQQTPADVKIAASKTKVHVTLRKAGFRALDQQVDVATFTEDDAKLSGTLSGKMEKAVVVNNGGGGGGGGTTHTAGTGTTGTGTTGTGTTGTGTTGTGTTGTGTTGTGTTGTGTTGTGSTGTGTTGTTGTGTTGTTGTGTTGTGTTGTGTTGTGTTGTGTTGTGTTGTGTTGTGTTGTGTTGTGAGSATKPPTTTTPSTGTGSAAKAGEPEPDWSKQH
jgi:uncharacterized protein (TIGR02266 family)